MMLRRWSPAAAVAMVLLVARLGAAPGADVVATAPKPSPLADAVQRGDAPTIQALLKKKADVNAPQADGATALHWAAYRSDAETTAALIRAGANVNRHEQLRRHAAGARREAGQPDHARPVAEGRRRIRTTRSISSMPTRRR